MHCYLLVGINMAQIYPHVAFACGLQSSRKVPRGVVLSCARSQDVLSLLTVLYALVTVDEDPVFLRYERTDAPVVHSCFALERKKSCATDVLLLCSHGPCA